MSVAAVVAAAGRGERLGSSADGPKALRLLAGLPMLAHAVRALAAAPSVSLVVVAAPAEHVGRTRSLLVGHHDGAELVVVEGAATRPGSVRAALAVLPAGVEVVLVHDAARPLVPVAVVEAVTAAVLAGAEGVVPVLPVVDTVKRVEGDTVTATVDRTSLRAVQTPQGFRRAVLERAYAGTAWDSSDVTDDAGLVERLGTPVVVVEGADEAFKVTRPLDLLLAEALVAGRA